MSGWRVGVENDMPVTPVVTAPPRDLGGDILVGVLSGLVVAVTAPLIWHFVLRRGWRA